MSTQMGGKTQNENQKHWKKDDNVENPISILLYVFCLVYIYAIQYCKCKREKKITGREGKIGFYES